MDLLNFEDVIFLECLSQKINVHRNTLRGWLCHYSLAPYLKNIPTESNGKWKYKLGYKNNKRSMRALRAYLMKRNKDYAIRLDSM